MSVSLQLMEYGRFGPCVRLSNDVCDLWVMVGCGPRIISFSIKGHENVFAELDKEGFETTEGFWYIRGGHRLWHSPESMPRTYTLDIEPVQWVELNNGVGTIQLPGKDGMRKEMDIVMDEDGPGVCVTHRIFNQTPWPVEFSVWALTAMAPGGTLIVPQNQRESGLLPNRTIVLWPYTDVRDERASFGNKFLLIRQGKGKTPFMFGQLNESGWAAYVVRDQLFVKYFSFENWAKYPDYGCSYESYCCDFMMEVESLSPLRVVEPGACSQHMERWRLWDGVQQPQSETEAEEIGRLMDQVSSGTQIKKE